MNNEPVAWMELYYGEPNNLAWTDAELKDSGEVYKTVPLYTHPVKEQKCVVKDCENHRNEGGFTGDLCNPCHQFIANGEGVYSQAYRNVHPVKELTDEEINELWLVICSKAGEIEDMQLEFARAILRKAQEK